MSYNDNNYVFYRYLQDSDNTCVDEAVDEVVPPQG
jgi:hypothetical protein